MALNTNNLTKGGQITAYSWRMFLQINTLISFWIVMLFVLLASLLVFLATSAEIINNGTWYWWADFNKSWLFLSEHTDKIKYAIHYYYAPTNVTYTLKMTLSQMLQDPYMIAAGNKFWHNIQVSLLIAGAFSLLVYFFVASWLSSRGRQQSADEFISGMTLCEEPKVVTKMLKANGEASDLRIGELALLKHSEIKNILLNGTVGVGKSTIIREIMAYIRKRGDRAIIYDSGCTFVETHYDENKDFILNPYDERCANWDLWGECRSMPDYDNMANSLIPMEGENDPFWVASARTIFAATASQMEKDDDRSIEKFLRVLLSISLKNLRAYLESTEAASLVEEKIEKTAISIRAVITNYGKALRYLQGLEGDTFSIRNWMRDEKYASSWLFISTNEEQRSSLRPLISMWLSLATIFLMSMGENSERRVWFIVDELTSLQKLPELANVLAQGRKFGSCFVLGMQNSAQMIDTYGRNLANSIDDLLNTRIYGRSPSATEAQNVEKNLGRQRRKEAREQYSYGPDQVRDGISMSKQEVIAPIVDYEKVMTLPDLTVYVRLPAEYPVIKLKLKYKKIPKVNLPLIARNFSESLSPDIEEMIIKNERNPVIHEIITEQKAQVENNYLDKIRKKSSSDTTAATTQGEEKISTHELLKKARKASEEKKEKVTVSPKNADDAIARMMNDEKDILRHHAEDGGLER